LCRNGAAGARVENLTSMPRWQTLRSSCKIAPDRMIGEVVGNYRIMDELGAGGVGVVYLGEHVLLGRKVAVKLLQQQFVFNSELVNRFFNEARAAASLRHPGLVDVFDYGRHSSGAAYLVMEFLEGESLSARMARERRVPLPLVLALGRQIANAIGVAHAKGIVHRDLKPDNVFLIPEDYMPFGVRAKVLDFGVAKLTGEMGSSTKTQTMAILGTPAYMSPEQCRGAGHVDHRADIYSLGCILFEMATGRRPFANDVSPIEVMSMHLFDTPDAPSKVNPNLPPRFDKFILKAMAKSPDERQQSMVDFAAEIDALTVGAPQSALPAGPAPEAPRAPSATLTPSTPLGPPTVVSPPPSMPTPTIAGTAPLTPEEAAPRSSIWYDALEVERVGAKLGEHQSRPYRIVGYRIGDSYRFSAVMVQDDVPQAWWFYGLDQGALSQKAAELGARIVDVETHGDPSARRFGAVLVKASEPWWWYAGLDAAQVSAKLQEHGARLVDIDAYVEGGTTRFTVSMVRAVGAMSWWYHGLDPQGLIRKFEEHQARPIAMNSYVENGARRFACVLMRNVSANWWWGCGLTAAEVRSKLAETNGYLVDVDVFLDGGVPKFSVILHRR
jgi:serine/threonine protein kinase